MIRSVFLIASTVCLCLSSLSIVKGDEENADAIRFPTETKTVVVKVVDENDKPVSDVEIQAYACRCEENRGSHWGWPDYNVGPAPKLKTDAEGKVALEYPVRFGREPDWNTTCEVTALVSHPEYISTTFDEDPREGPIVVEVKSGCQLTLSAVDQNGLSIPFAAMMAGPGRSAKWLVDEDGARRSRAIPDGSWQTMLVSPREDGIHLFSGILPVRLRDGQSVSVRNLRLKPGLRMAGRLDASVPRPVKNGRVVAHCIPKPAGRTWGDDDPSLTWEQSTPINEDGTFEFSSLPRQGLIQLITVCDTHVGKNIDVPEPNRAFRQGMFVTIEECEDLENLVIPMEPTGSIVVTVLDPNGKPLPGANVGTWPNHSAYLGGSTILGTCFDSIELVRLQIDPSGRSAQDIYAQREIRFSGETDENGKATILGIPLGTESLSVQHDEFLMSSLQGVDRGQRFTLEDSAPKEITVNMVSPDAAKLSKSIEAVKKAAEAVKGLIE